MATQNQFVTFTPYDEQMAEIQRRQRMADLMQQQAQAPLETPQSGGRMIAKVSPVAGLAKMLQAYMGGKEQRAIGEQQKELGRQDIQNAMSLMDRLQAGKPSEMSSDQALAASMSTQPTAQAPNQPFSNVEQRQFLATQGMLGGPRTQALAAALMPKPETPEYYDAVPVTVNGVTKMVQYSKGVGAPRILEGQKFEKPSAPHTATIMKNGKRMVVDVVTGQEVGEAPAEYRAPEELKAVIGIDGKPIYVKASEAVGKTPYVPAAEKLKPVPPSEVGKMEQNFISIKKLDTTLSELEKHPNSIGLKFGVSQKVNDRADPKGIALRAGIADVGSLVLHDRSGAAITAAESPRLMPFIPTITDTAEAARQKLQRFRQEYMNILNEQNSDYAPEYGWSRPGILNRYTQYQLQNSAPQNLQQQPTGVKPSNRAAGYLPKGANP